MSHQSNTNRTGELSDLARIYDLDDLDEVILRKYLRVSKDESGRARSNSEQNDDLDEVAERKRRWSTHPDSYEDVGSASKFKRKRRPDFDNLVADLRAGTFGAHVLGIWEASRGSREVPEWYMLLGLLAEAGVFVYVHNLRRVFNPHIAADWGDLMRAAVKAEEEVRQSQERIVRATNADAEAGTWKGGRRPFGYGSDGVTICDGSEPDTIDEATLIRLAVADVIAGKANPRSIAARWNAMGVPTTAGNRWHPSVVGNILRSPRIAGKRIHHGEVIGKAAWPAIIDEITHKRVVAMLAARSPIGRRGRQAWTGTGYLVCEFCGEALVGNTDTRGTRRYVCRKAPGYKGCGRIGIKAEPVEALLGEMLSDRMVDLEARRAADLGPDDGDERAGLDEIDVEIAEAFDERAKGKRNGGITTAEFRQIKDRLDGRKRVLLDQLAAKVREVVPLDLVDDGRRWDALTVAEQRRRLDSLVAWIKVGPATNRGSTAFERSRVAAKGRVKWKA